MIGLFETGCALVAGWALVELHFSRKARKEYSRAKAFYEDKASCLVREVASNEPNRPAFAPGDTELCGGCGHMLPPESIAACPGETCFRYQEPQFRTDPSHNATTIFIKRAPKISPGGS